MDFQSMENRSHHFIAKDFNPWKINHPILKPWISMNKKNAILLPLVSQCIFSLCKRTPQANKTSTYQQFVRLNMLLKTLILLSFS